MLMVYFQTHIAVFQIVTLQKQTRLISHTFSVKLPPAYT